MRSLQQMKQLELNLGPVAEIPPSHRFEEFIASHLSESPTGQVRLMESICEWSNMKRAVKRVLKQVRGFLTAGVTIGGLEEPTRQGTPQGGPISALLSNIVLDELDKELERRGLCFVRYADDCVIFVRSKRAGDRVMESVSRFIEKKLRLKINREKSAVGRPWDRKYLGFCMTNSRSAPKIRIHWKTIKRFKERVREITARRRGRSINQVIDELNEYMRGWRLLPIPIGDLRFPTPSPKPLTQFVRE